MLGWLLEKTVNILNHLLSAWKKEDAKFQKPVATSKSPCSYKIQSYQVFQVELVTIHTLLNKILLMPLCETSLGDLSDWNFPLIIAVKINILHKNTIVVKRK